MSSNECEVSTKAPSLDATATGEQAADAEDAAAVAELKQVAAELVVNVKGAAQWCAFAELEMARN